MGAYGRLHRLRRGELAPHTSAGAAKTRLELSQVDPDRCAVTELVSPDARESDDVDRGRERLGCDPVHVTGEDGRDVLAERERELDSVADVQSRLFSSLLHVSHDVPGSAFRLEIGIGFAVEDDDARRVVENAAVLFVGCDGDELVLAGEERNVAGDHASVVVEDPVTALDRVDGFLGACTEAWSDGGRDDAEAFFREGRDVVGKVHLLDVDLVEDELRELR